MYSSLIQCMMSAEERELRSHHMDARGDSLLSLSLTHSLSLSLSVYFSLGFCFTLVSLVLSVSPLSHIKHSLSIKPCLSCLSMCLCVCEGTFLMRQVDVYTFSSARPARPALPSKPDRQLVLYSIVRLVWKGNSC